mmetsp:Transcript_2579/g.4680  ORF Transcript_2579/g.4680 Transcript_2579/m.4680 type:complete len:787 (+) Transcript_2579:69-2429(+)
MIWAKQANLLCCLITLLCIAECAAAQAAGSLREDPLGATAASPPGAIAPPPATPAVEVGTGGAPTTGQMLPETAVSRSPFHDVASVSRGATAAGAAASVQAAAEALRETNAHMTPQQAQMPAWTQRPNTQAAAASAPPAGANQDFAAMQHPAVQAPISAHANLDASSAVSPDTIPNTPTNSRYPPSAAVERKAPGVLDPSTDASTSASGLPHGVKALYASPPPSKDESLEPSAEQSMPREGTSSAQPIEDRAASRLMRREAPARSTAAGSEYVSNQANAKSQTFDDTAQTERYKDKEYKEDPNLTPEAIYSNKKLAPDIMEFLGHLAKNRQYRRNAGRPQSAVHGPDGVLAEGHQGLVENGDDKDDDAKDDNEDRLMVATKGKSNTAISMFFDKIDSKNDAASWLPGDCAALARNVSAHYGTVAGSRSPGAWGLAGPATAQFRSAVNTGIFLQHWKVGNMKQAIRKLRLGILSFLATQDALKLKLHIWTDMDRDNAVLQEILGPINSHPEMLDAINITKFDPWFEFAKVPPSIARDRLHERYEQDAVPMLRPDLYRAVILYNYGGLWMDADTMLMQDVVPLMGEDWAYIARGKQGAVEGALLSSSKPFSHFANEYLMNMIMKEEPLFGNDVPGLPGEDRSVLDEIFENDPDHLNFHVLPPCFVDTEPSQNKDSAVLASDAVPDSSFFGRSVPSSYRDLFSLGIEEAEQEANNGTNANLAAAALELPAAQAESGANAFGTHSTASPSWAFHWRGKWDAPWKQGSFADVAERTFMKKLRLARTPKYFS